MPGNQVGLTWNYFCRCSLDARCPTAGLRQNDDFDLRDIQRHSCKMTSLIIAGLILSILSGVALCPPIFEDVGPLSPFGRYVAMVEAISHVCNKDSFKSVIKCERKPGRFKMELLLQKLS